MERTLVILKPDCLARRLVGEVVGRFEWKGLQIVGMKMLKISPAVARKMYAIHRGEEFYQPLVRFMTSGPVVVMALEGKDAVAVVRKMLGPTFGPDAPPGSIRGDLGMSKRYNLVHGSDTRETAGRELPLFFKQGELLTGTAPDFGQIYDTTGPEPV